MVKTAWQVILTVTVFCFSAHAEEAAAATAEPSLQIQIRVYNYADASESVIAHAKGQTVRLLATAGVGAAWIECSPALDEEMRGAACETPTTPADILIRILPKGTRRKVGKKGGALGYALIGGGQAPARYANVLFENVELLARERRERAAYGTPERSVSGEKLIGVLLGHAIAHEVGHLLMRTNGHSRRGLMQANWDSATTARAVAGQVRFQPREALKIRQGVRRRLAAIE